MDFASVKDNFTENKVQTLLLLAVGLVIGSAAAMVGPTGDLLSDSISAEQAGDMVKTTMEDYTTQSFEVVNVRETSGLYKVDLKNSQNTLQTYYVTKDGQHLSTSMTNFTQLRTVVKAQKEFRNCLSDKNVVLYGNQSQRATLAQIQVLGGAQNVAAIYQDVNTEGVLQQAVKKGVRRVPSFYMNGSVLGGVSSMNKVEEFTGCQMAVQ